MSNAEPEEAVKTARDGISIEKSFEPDDFPVPAIAFVIRSERDEPVSARMVDTVPEDVPAEDIGFHPKYGAEHWSVEGSKIVFERRFEADEEYTTVYGLRGGDAEEAERFMSEPTLESVDPPLSEDSGRVVRDVLGDDTETPNDDDIASAIAAADSTDTDIDIDAGADASATDDEETHADEPTGSITLDTPVEESTGTLVAELASEIRTGGVDDDDLDVLRDALGETATAGSVDARIEHLQSEVADLTAYTDALEAFLDENGDAQRLLRELREEFADTTGRVDTMESTLETATSSIGETEARVQDTLEGVDERVEDALDDRIGATEAELEEALDDIENALDEIDGTVESRVDGALDELWVAVDEATADAADVADDVESLQAELEELESTVGDEFEDRVEDIESDIDEIATEIEDLAEMRERLTEVFGAFGGQAQADDDETSEE